MTRLAQIVRPHVEAHPGKSGVFALRSGRDAFAARIMLADTAELTLDVQYYIWRNDISGTLLLQALRRAAARGVQVRLLLDDNSTSGLDHIFRALDSLPNIDVRLFNPFHLRRWRILNIHDFTRLNRRMHNKSFTADNQVTIVGGRNVGDQYFGVAKDMAFVDLDALAIGPVVADVSTDFNRYWNSRSAFPVEQILPPVDAPEISAIADAAFEVERRPAAVAFMRSIAESEFVASLRADTLPLEWAIAEVVSDDPAKVLGRARRKELMWPRLERILRSPVHELQLISAYFVPGKAGVRAFAAMARRGVKITVVTNSLEATDVAAVHSGYARRRKKLLESGVALFEMKRLSSAPVRKLRGKRGSSASSLHAKTFSVDGARVFIGSFNFDPRSARLNTEMGLIINSPALARSVADTLEQSLPHDAYEVQLDAGGRLHWLERIDGKDVVHEREPGAGFWLRIVIAVLSLLPIEWLL